MQPEQLNSNIRKNPIFPVDFINHLFRLQISPSLKSILALKQAAGWKLDPMDIIQALKSPHPNPIKTWLQEMVLCYVRYLTNRDHIVAQHLFVNRLKKEEYELFLTEYENIKNHQRIQDIIKELDLEAVALQAQQQVYKTLNYYQLLQTLKAEEYSFYASVIKDPKLLQKAIIAIDARYHWLARGNEVVHRIEEELRHSNLSLEQRAYKEEQVATYKDHLRLSSLEMKKKIIPEYINDPEMAVHVAQLSATNEEINVKFLEDIAPYKNQSLLNANKLPSDQTLYTLPMKWSYLDLQDNLNNLLNTLFEKNPNIIFPQEANLVSLLTLLNKTKETIADDLKATIFIKTQNIISSLQSNPAFKGIVSCLEKWLKEQSSFNPNGEAKKSILEKDDKPAENPTDKVTTTNILKNIDENDNNELYKKIATSVKSCIANETSLTSVTKDLLLEIINLTNYINSQNITQDDIVDINERIVKNFNSVVQSQPDIRGLNALRTSIADISDSTIKNINTIEDNTDENFSP